jgi:hypothetical protein
MPSMNRHLEFDEKRLKKNRVICEETSGRTVHKRMDRNVKKYGSDHRNLDEWHSPDGIRDMIDNFVETVGIDPITATDYVRIAYGHRCLDYIASKYPTAEWGEVFTRAYRLFRSNDFHNKRYRPRM